ncbi:MAG TPA: hypothetical protein VF516_46685 [Kofleriaceae bacterium]
MAPPGTLDVDTKNVDDDVDLDSSVELDGSEAIRRRLTPPSTSTPASRSAEARGTGSVDVQRRGWAQRRTVPSTSTLWVDDQVNVDDHEHRRRLVTNHQTATSTSTTAVKVKAQVDLNRAMRPEARFGIS